MKFDNSSYRTAIWEKWNTAKLTSKFGLVVCNSIRKMWKYFRKILKCLDGYHFVKFGLIEKKNKFTEKRRPLKTWPTENNAPIRKVKKKTCSFPLSIRHAIFVAGRVLRSLKTRVTSYPIHGIGLRNTWRWARCRGLPWSHSNSACPPRTSWTKSSRCVAWRERLASGPQFSNFVFLNDYLPNHIYIRIAQQCPYNVRWDSVQWEFFFWNDQIWNHRGKIYRKERDEMDSAVVDFDRPGTRVDEHIEMILLESGQLPTLNTNLIASTCHFRNIVNFKSTVLAKCGMRRTCSSNSGVIWQWISATSKKKKPEFLTIFWRLQDAHLLLIILWQIHFSCDEKRENAARNMQNEDWYCKMRRKMKFECLLFWKKALFAKCCSYSMPRNVSSNLLPVRIFFSSKFALRVAKMSSKCHFGDMNKSWSKTWEFSFHILFLIRKMNVGQPIKNSQKATVPYWERKRCLIFLFRKGTLFSSRSIWEFMWSGFREVWGMMICREDENMQI